MKWLVFTFRVLIIFCMLTCLQSCQDNIHKDADNVHVEIPYFVDDERNVHKFAQLVEIWNKFSTSEAVNDEDITAAKKHVECALVLFYWNMLSEPQRASIHSESIEALRTMADPGKELNGQRMIFEMSHLIDIKWKLKRVPKYSLPPLEYDLWEHRDRYFAGIMAKNN